MQALAASGERELGRTWHGAPGGGELNVYTVLWLLGDFSGKAREFFEINTDRMPIARVNFLVLFPQGFF